MIMIMILATSVEEESRFSMTLRQLLSYDLRQLLSYDLRQLLSYDLRQL